MRSFISHRLWDLADFFWRMSVKLMPEPDWMEIVTVDHESHRDIWSKGLVKGIAYAMRVQNDPDTWEPENPYED